MNKVLKNILTNLKNISRFIKDQLTFNCSQKQKKKIDEDKKYCKQYSSNQDNVYQEHSFKMETDNGRVLGLLDS